MITEGSCDIQNAKSHFLSPGLFNLRGSDIEYNPVFFAYAIIGISSIK